MESTDSPLNVILNRPIFTYCAGFSVLLFLLNFVLPDCVNRIGLVPANTLITNTYVWNLVTSCFYETNILKLAVEIFAFWFSTRSIINPSLEQFGLYFAFSILASTLGVSAYSFIRFFTSGTEGFLINPIYGCSGVVIALLMYTRQQRRNEPVYASYPLITYHHLPVLVVLVLGILALLGLKSLSADFPFAFVSLFFSWSYLRFYFRYNDIDVSGDKSDEFSFVTMFPEVLHIILIPFTTAFYNIFALIGVFPVLEVTEKKTFHHLRYSNDTPAPLSLTAESAALAAAEAAAAVKPDLVAERRRAKALKLLDAKMAELSQEPEGWEDTPSPPPATTTTKMATDKKQEEMEAARRILI